MKKKHSLYKQLLLRTIFFLILPFLILQVCLAAKIIGEGEKSYEVGVDLTVERAVDIRRKNLDNIKKIENRITANKTLKGFFLVKFTPQNLQYYSSEIQRIINPGPGEDDLYAIRVFYPNETIPRGFNTFYFLRDFAVGGEADFLRSRATDRWVLPQEAGQYSSLYTPYSRHYTYMKKVFAGKRLVYVLTISVPETEMDSFLGDAQDYVCTRETLTLDYSGKSRHTMTRNYQFDDFPQSLTFVFSKNSQEVYVIAIIGAIMLLIAVMIAMVLGLVRNIFQRIYACVDEFKESADRGFCHKLEIDESNEVARLKEAFNQQIDKIQELLKLTREQVELVKDSQIMALQHQMNPHFLYNTLEVFSYKMELYHHYEEAEAIIAFSKMMRYNVVESSGYATIRQEVDQVENYLCIQRMKYQKIAVEIQIPHELYDFEVPRFLFQPLIENSILHGYYGEPLKIVLTCRREEGYIHFQVWDNGQGMEAHEAARINEALRTRGEGVGIGLMNIHSRLCLLYSDSCGLLIDSVKMKWTAMEFRIPDYSGGG